MKDLRRYDIRKTYYFITVVTFNREKLSTEYMDIFWKSWAEQKLFAWAVLPDHFHAIIWIDDLSISKIIHGFKIRYYHEVSRISFKRKIWQNRFWDHIIRTQDDMNRHLDYIHFNSVKHNPVDDPFKYEHSSLKSFHQEGYYQRDWGVKKEPILDGEFGE